MRAFLLPLLLSPLPLAAEIPRWGHIRYDQNSLEYTVPKCEQSSIQSISLRRDGKRIAIRLDCAPVPGEILRPNPDLHGASK